MERIAAAFAAVSVGPALEDPGLGPLISGPQRDRVAAYVAGSGPRRPHPLRRRAAERRLVGRGFFFEPTLIDEVGPASPMFREEVFGPVLAVTPFADARRGRELANGTDYGLVAGVWTTDISTAAAA